MKETMKIEQKRLYAIADQMHIVLGTPSLNLNNLAIYPYLTKVG